MTLSNREIERYSRQTIIPGFGVEGQEKLKNASVLVVGAGGLGVPVMQYLVAAGIGRIVLVDHDHVSLTNLHRQVLYNESEIGKPKAAVAGNKLSWLNNDILIEPHEVRLDATNISSFVEDVDVVLDGSDNFETRYLVNDACVLHNRPLVYGAVNRMEGQLAVFNVPLESGQWSAHYRDLFPEVPEPGFIMSCAEAGVLGPVTGLIGSLMALEAIKWIAGVGQPLVGEMMQIDCNTLEFRKIRYKKESQLPIYELGNYAPFCMVDDRLIPWEQVNPDEHYLVDVRQPVEKEVFDPGGKLIPLNELAERFRELPEDQSIVFYCQTGIRSDQAVQIMARLSDRTDVYSVEGGIFSREDYQG